MRYFHIFVVINSMLTGILHAAELPQPQSDTPAGLEEEPPQRATDAPATSPDAATQTEAHATAPDASAAPLDMPLPPETTAPVSPDQTSKSADSSTQNPHTEATPAEAPAAETAPAEEEPTIEDAEQVEAAAEHDIPQMPPQPDITTTPLPAEPASHEPNPEAAEGAEPQQGIDTVDLENPQGNWLFKRYWWERAEEVYKKIRTHVEKINDNRVKFFARRTELDKTILDPFYADTGLTQSELQRSIQSLMSQLEQDRERQGMLDETERELMHEAEKDRERLEQLNRDIQGISGLRTAADKIVDRVMDQKNRATRFETEAWDSMREIGRIVSDTQASELYYRMDAGWRTVKDIYKYIDQDLNRYFDTLLANAREQIERIKTSLQALKEQGVDLKMRIQEAEQQEVQKELAHEEEEKARKAAKPEKTGWFATTSRLYQAVIDVALWQFLQSIWDALMWLPRRIYSSLSSLFR